MEAAKNRIGGYTNVSGAHASFLHTFARPRVMNGLSVLIKATKVLSQNKIKLELDIHTRSTRVLHTLASLV